MPIILPPHAFEVPAIIRAASAMERTAVLTVPAEALIFSGAGLQAPDDEGQFAIGIKLPQPGLRVAHCDTVDTGFLTVGMGHLNKPESDLTAADRQSIARSHTYYDQLVAASRHGGTVTIPVRNDAVYLKVTKDIVFATYCQLSIDESKIS